MENEKVWGKIRKTVLDSVTIAAEKTEEYTKLGKAKLDALAVKRTMTKKQTQLGEHVYKAVKEGAAATVMDSGPVKIIIDEMSALENELQEKQKIYAELRSKVESDVEKVKEKAKSGVEEIKNKAKSQVERMRKKSEKKEEQDQSASGEKS